MSTDRSAKTTVRFLVQTYVRAPELKPSRRIDVASLDEARATARAMVPTVAGAIAVRLTVDAETRAVWTIEVMEAIGEFPPDYGEHLDELFASC